MATATAAISRPPRTPLLRGIRPVVGFVAVSLALLVAWEAAKWLGGDPWRVESLLGSGIAIQHDPPFRWRFASDLNLPHIWTIAGAFSATDARGDPLVGALVSAAAFTLRGAVVGFILGTVVGLGLAIVLVHVRILERALVPLLVMSQTIPIVALAPIIVVGLGAGWLGIAIVASYLTFFPVTVAAIRGLRSADARAVELLRSYAASRIDVLWKLRLPASLPYLFTAFKISATASIVGAIVGELPSGFREGLGGTILRGMQYYTLQPQNLWATVIVAAVLGILAFVVVLIVERWVLRDQRPMEPGAAR